MEKYQKARKLFAWITGILMISTSIHYNWNMYHNPNAEPILATWILMCVAVTLSLWTFLSTFKTKKEKVKGLVSNIGNSTNLVAIWMILIGIFLWGNNVRFGFKKFEIYCLIASLIILMIWKFSKWHSMANISIQIIMVIAYIPTIMQLYNAKYNTEPFFVWTIIFLAATSSLVPAIIDKNKLAMFYALRGMILVGTILALMIRLELNF